jgi:hypothetical protein
MTASPEGEKRRATAVPVMGWPGIRGLRAISTRSCSLIWMASA